MRVNPISHLSAALLLATLSASCGEDRGSDAGPDGELHPWAIQAQNEIPDLLTLHTKVISRTCAPNGGVCHNGKEYPDLHTPGNLLTSVSNPCNRDLTAQPEKVFDGCEPEADTLESGDFRTRIGWIGVDVYDPLTGQVRRPIRLEHAPDEDLRGERARFERKGDLVVRVPGNLWVEAGSKEGYLSDLYLLEYSDYLALSTLVGGDPNGNGVFGAEDPWAEIAPGRPEKSYLWARITGTVPGTRMPLANRPISNAEYVAIACWIETLGSDPGVEQAIDYDGCWYARDPGDYEYVPE